MNSERNTRIAALALVLTLVFSFVLPASASATYESPGFASAEDALMAYIEGLQQGDLQQMIGAFAIETYIEHFDLVAWIERVISHSFHSTSTVRLPNANPMVTALNIESRRANILGIIQYQLIAFHLEEQFESGPLIFGPPIGPFPHDILGSAEDFVDMLRTNMETMALQSMQLVSFMEPAMLAEAYDNEKNQADLDRKRAIYGADELKSVAAFFTVDGKLYVLCADAIRYGERWYLESLAGNIGAHLRIDVFQGGIMQITQ